MIRLLILAVFLAGACLHVSQRWGTWVWETRKKHKDAGYKDYWHYRGPLVLKNAGIVIVLGALWCVGLLNKMASGILAFFGAEMPEAPDPGVQMAVALTAGFFLSFGSDKILDKLNQRKLTGGNQKGSP